MNISSKTFTQASITNVQDQQACEVALAATGFDLPK